VGLRFLPVRPSADAGQNEEIELDIDSLPPATVVKLYNLVCRGGRKPGRPKGQTAVGQGKKPGRKGTGGVSKRSMNEQEEAARIKRMEQQLQNFNSQPTYEETDESSEEEESDEE
jgi:bromodomain-containing factor 1